MMDSSDNDHNYNKGDKLDDDEDIKLDDHDSSNNNDNDNNNEDNNANQACVVHFDDKPWKEDDKIEDQGWVDQDTKSEDTNGSGP